MPILKDILENKVFQKLKFKFTKKCGPKLLFSIEKNQKDSDDVSHRKLTLKIRYWFFFDKVPAVEFKKYLGML